MKVNIRRAEIIGRTCLLEKSAVQSIPNNAQTDITFNLAADEVYDPEDMHSLTASPDRVTIDRAGVYLVCAGLRFAANAVGQRGVIIEVNAADTAQTQVDAAAAGNTFISTSIVLNLDVDDFVEVQAFQDSGGPLNVDLGNTSFLCVAMLAGQ